MNIDGCRIEGNIEEMKGRSGKGFNKDIYGKGIGRNEGIFSPNELGRWPANLIIDGSEEVIELFPSAPGQLADIKGTEPSSLTKAVFGERKRLPFEKRIDNGSAARFFYTAKADKKDRLNSNHPTVKPVDLMRYLVRLIIPKGGTVLDPFAGTGTTAIAAYREGMQSILIERETKYQENIINRSRKRWGTSSLFSHIKD